MELCPNCNGELREIEVRIDSERTISYQCKFCKFFSLHNIGAIRA